MFFISRRHGIVRWGLHLHRFENRIFSLRDIKLLKQGGFRKKSVTSTAARVSSHHPQIANGALLDAMIPVVRRTKRTSTPAQYCITKLAKRSINPYKFIRLTAS